MKPRWAGVTSPVVGYRDPVQMATVFSLKGKSGEVRVYDSELRKPLSEWGVWLWLGMVLRKIERGES